MLSVKDGFTVEFVALRSRQICRTCTLRRSSLARGTSTRISRPPTSNNLLNGIAPSSVHGTSPHTLPPLSLKKRTTHLYEKPLCSSCCC